MTYFSIVLEQIFIFVIYAVTMSVLSALPTMTSVTMLAQIQKSADEYSAGMIFVTTLFSSVTLPLVCFAIG